MESYDMLDAKLKTLKDNGFNHKFICAQMAQIKAKISKLLPNQDW